jgi:hypothetical protein
MTEWPGSLGIVRVAILGFVASLLAWSAGIAPASAQVLTGDTVQQFRRALFGGIVNEIGTLPTPSGGGFTYEFDPQLGVFTRTTDSFGPIFADRAETTGRGKITLSASYSRFTFDTLDGVNLHDGSLQGLAIGLSSIGPRFGFVSFREDVDADVFTLAGIYGVTDRLDVGITLPILRVKIKERPKRIGFIDCNSTVTVCQNFVPQDLDFLPQSRESTGIGDLELRAKYNFWRMPELWGGKLSAAASLNVKLPTGDSGERTKFENARDVNGPQGLVTDSFFELGDPPLGTGIVRVKPQLIVSGSWFGVSPHINVGAELGTTEGITNDLVYAAGLDFVTAAGRVTLVGDLLGRHAFDVKRTRVLPNTIVPTTATASADTLIASLGVKVNPFRTLVLFFNILKPLNKTGLKDDVTPTAGLEWSF